MLVFCYNQLTFLILTTFELFRVISTEMGRKLAEQWKGVFVESSAKQNEVSLRSFFIC